TGGSHGNPHSTAGICSHAWRIGSRVASRGASAATTREGRPDRVPRCPVPEGGGIRHAASTFREALWARYFTAVLGLRTPSELIGLAFFKFRHCQAPILWQTQKCRPLHRRHNPFYRVSRCKLVPNIYH